MGLAGAGVPDQTQRLSLLDPFALGEGVDHGGIDVGVGVEVEGPQGLLAGELGGLDPAFGPASGAIVALGTESAMAGYRVKYNLATQLANELVEAADEMTLAKTIARYGRVDLLCIDELGYMQLDRRGAELLFQVLTEREEKASVAIASNESFGGWTKTFTDPRLCAAIVDRLTFGGTILETGTDSYRLAQATKQRTT